MHNKNKYQQSFSKSRVAMALFYGFIEVVKSIFTKLFMLSRKTKTSIK